MNEHFRMCASAYRDGAMIDATVYAGLPDRCHDGKITRIDLCDPKVLRIHIGFTRSPGVCEDLVWTWESRCLVPYGGQQKVELIGTFEGGRPFIQGGSIPDSKPDYVACPFIVIAKDIAHEPRLGCRSVLAGTDGFPKDYKRVYPDPVTYPDSKASKAECEAWRMDNCIGSET